MQPKITVSNDPVIQMLIINIHSICLFHHCQLYVLLSVRFPFFVSQNHSEADSQDSRLQDHDSEIPQPSQDNDKT